LSVEADCLSLTRLGDGYPVAKFEFPPGIRPRISDALAMTEACDLVAWTSNAAGGHPERRVASEIEHRGGVLVWSGANGKLLQPLDGTASVLAFSPGEGHLLAGGTEDGR